MRSAKILTLVVGLMLVKAGTASAFSLAGDYTGPLAFKFTDFSAGNLYESSSDGYGQADGKEDAWGVFKVTTIQTPDATQTLWSDGDDGEQLTGIYRALDDDLWTVNTETGALNIQSVGAKLDLYLDSATPFNANGGPGLRVGNTYPTVTDGSLFLTADFVPGIKYGDGIASNDYISYDNNLDGTTSPFTGDGAFYLDVTGGAFASLFDTNTQCVTDDSGNIVCRDFFGQFDTSTEGAGQWLVKSEDPITGAAGVIPEPGSMFLLGSGLIGMAKLRKKKLIG